MAKLSSYRRIYEQDYQGANQELIKQIATPINSSFEELYNLNNNNITFSDNINCTLATFNVTVDANGKPLNSTQFKLSIYQTSVKGLWVINTLNNANNSLYPPSAVFVSFVRADNNVIINNVKGLTPNVGYSITVITIS